MTNPWKLLFASRKFWLLILDTVVSSLTLILTQVLAPEQLGIALQFIAIYQPVFIFLIGAIAYEDGKIIPPQISLLVAAEYNEAMNKGDKEVKG